MHSQDVPSFQLVNFPGDDAIMLQPSNVPEPNQHIIYSNKIIFHGCNRTSNEQRRLHVQTVISSCNPYPGGYHCVRRRIGAGLGFELVSHQLAFSHAEPNQS